MGRYSTFDYGALARKALARDLEARDVAYEMPNGRVFYDDAGVGSFYTVSLAGITQETFDASSGSYGAILTEDQGRQLQE